MKVLMAGGGTLGSVTPLLAVADELKVRQPDIQIAWIGTSYGPEQKLMRDYSIKFYAIVCGRWRRYFSIQNIFDLFRLLVGLGQSLIYILKWRPQVVISAGSFVAVPVGWAAWLVRVPVIIHQQDLVPGLANKLLKPFARQITVAWPNLLKYFPADKTEVIGNPVRKQISQPAQLDLTRQKFGWTGAKPVVLIMGGGTGAEFINTLLIACLPDVTAFARVIHLAGEFKSTGAPQADYQAIPLAAADFPALLQLASLVVTRAGMGTISELSALAKPAIIIPIPNSHQEVNAGYIQVKQAAVVLHQSDLNPIKFVGIIKKLLSNQIELARLSNNMGALMPKDASQRAADIILKIAKT